MSWAHSLPQQIVPNSAAHCGRPFDSTLAKKSHQTIKKKFYT